MPEGKVQTFSITEYPEFEDLSEGNPVIIRAEGKIQKIDQVEVQVKWDSYEIETENQADKDLKTIKGEKQVYDAEEYGEDDF